MVTSIAPILEQNMPRAQARAGGRNTYSAFDFCAYCDPTTSAAPLTKQTPAQSEYTFTNCTGTNLSNQQYSITAITTSTGAISERYAYTAYGQPTILDASGSSLSPQVSSLNNRYTYTGREWDATLGLHHFRARWMSPSAGRFLTRDPIGFEGSEWDLYEFVSSLPLVRVDPFGESDDWGFYPPCFWFHGKFICRNTPPTLPAKPPIGPPGFWSFLPCFSLSYTYTITVSAWGFGGLNPLPVGAIPNRWLPVPVAGGGTPVSPVCPQGYTCCITSIVNSSFVLTINARRGWIRQVAVDARTVVSIGNCQKANCPCPPPSIKTTPTQRLTIEINEFPSP